MLSQTKADILCKGNSSEEHDSLDEDALNTVPTLLYMTARIVAKVHKCETLEQHDPPLDEALLQKVRLRLPSSD